MLTAVGLELISSVNQCLLTLEGAPCARGCLLSIVYSFLLQSGKAWEIWLHAVPSGRQMVDRGGVPTKNFVVMSVQRLMLERLQSCTVRCSQCRGRIDAKQVL